MILARRRPSPVASASSGRPRTAPGAHDEQGAVAVEYGLATALFALASIAVIRVLGDQLGEVFASIVESIAG